MERRTKNLFLGCGGGCLLVILLGIGSCVGFRSWLRSPGELLEPESLLDEAAVGYLEGRLELDNPGTVALAETLSDFLRKEPPRMESFSVLRLLYQWNQGRKIKEFYRLFPANVAWTMYPVPEGEPGDTESLFTISVQRASHQFQLMDWFMGFVFRGRDENALAPGLGSFRYRGETVVRIEDENKGEEKQSIFLFVRKEGLFLGTGLGAVKRGIDRLEGGDLQAAKLPPVAATRSSIENAYSELPGGFQFRGAFSNSAGELIKLLPPIRGEQSLEETRLREALERCERLTVLGGFLPDGQLRLEFRVIGDPAVRAAVEALLERSRGSALVGSAWQTEVEEQDDGVTVVLFIPDVAPVLERGFDSLLPWEDRGWKEPGVSPRVPVRRD